MISAVKHTDYIERTGKYKNQDIKDDILNQKFENTISGSAKDSTNNSEGILYHSPYGDIISENNSIKVSKNASIETIAIALAIAEKIYTKEKINLKGSNNFKASALIAAKNLSLDIHFADSIIDNKYKNMQEVQKNVRRKKSGSRSGKNRNRSKIFKSDTKSIKRNELKTVTETGFSLPSLSERYMVRNMPKDTDMLLYGNEAGSLDNERSNYNSTLRWDVSRSRRLAAQKTAEIILNNLQEQHVYKKDEIDLLCESLAILPPMVPMDILAKASNIDKSLIVSFSADLGLALFVKEENDSIQFRDEPVETWFKKRFKATKETYELLSTRLFDLKDSNPYVAITIPRLLYGAKRYDDLYNNAYSNKLDITDPIQQQTIIVENITYSIKIASQQKDFLNLNILLLLKFCKFDFLYNLRV